MPDQNFGDENEANIRSIRFDPNTWAELTDAEAVQEIFRVGIAHVNELARWYSSRKGNKAFGSRLLRFIAIVGGTLGALAPIVAAMVPQAEKSLLQLQITQAGYLAVGTAAGALAFDRFFGLSNGWMRYMTAMTTIERVRLEFVSDWAKMRRESPSAKPADVLIALDRVTLFRKALLQLVEDETKAWLADFQNTMQELGKFIQETRTKTEAALQEMEKQQAAQQAAPTTGSLNLTLVAEWEGAVEISVAGQSHGKTIERKIGITDLKPGPNIVKVSGNKNGKAALASEVVLVDAGKIATLTL